MWFYNENGGQRGPITEADLEALVQAGKIDSETLVWREGMAEWQPYRVARPGPAGGAPPALAPATGDGVVCAECGGRFPASDVLEYSGVNVCAGCKPIFVQKLREGVRVGGQMEYASFGLRFGAYFLDAIITGVIGAIVGAIVGAVIGGLAGKINPSTITTVQLASFGLNMLIVMSYHTFFVGKYGATPGKMACKIKIVNADGSPVSYAKAAVRWLCYYVSCFTLFIGFLMILWDPEKRALHDRICNTRVIKN